MQLFFSYIISTFLIYFILNTLNKSVRNAEVVLGTGWTGAHPPHPPQAAQVSVILTREGHNTKCHHSFITHCGGQCPGVGATTQSKETTASKDCTFHTNGKNLHWGTWQILLALKVHQLLKMFSLKDPRFYVIYIRSFCINI